MENSMKRILIVDDDEELRAQFVRLLKKSGNRTENATLIQKVMGRLNRTETPSQSPVGYQYHVDSAAQGQDAYELVKKSLEGNNPYAVIFMDMRMPPGWDGLETIEKIWEIDSNPQVVICSAYSDYKWQDIVKRLGHKDNLFILRKPFEADEVSQLALALVEKYTLLVNSRKKMTDLEKAEEELRKTKNYLDNIFQALPSMLITVDHDGIVKRWNKAAEDYIGISQENAISKNIKTLLPFMEQFWSDFNEVVNSCQSKELKHVNVSSAGSLGENYLDISMYPLTYVGLEGIVFKIDEVTEAVKKDEHLRQAQKMDTVGNLAAGLAHDFNNVIGGIQATVSSIIFSLETASDLQALKKDVANDINIIADAAANGAEMIEQLMSISRRKEQQFSLTDLSKTIHSVLNICRHTLGKKIEIITRFPEGAMVEAFPTQLEQALLNLCVNASHAMTIMRPEGEQDKGGTLTITLEKIAVGEHLSEMFDAKQGNYWILSVSDTGVGMTKETISKIFDPFFTTKEKGKGTGLGLSMVYNIIRQHHGFMEIYSEPGNGSTFMIFLPAVEQEEKSRISISVRG
jgi:PAS domain S-box-containing protein